MTILPFCITTNNRAEAVGTEFRVNTYTADAQMKADAAMDASGNFVIVWETWGQDGDVFGIAGQRFDSTGTPLGSEFLVNSYTTGQQRNPAVAMEPGGDFVVVWQSEGQDGSGNGVFGQRYRDTGQSQGNEFQVNTFTTLDQRAPDVAMDASGNFIVVWMSDVQDGDNAGIFAQRYGSNGNPSGSEFQVNNYTTNTQKTPSVDMDPLGNFVIAYASYGQDGNGDGIFARRYDNTGTPFGDEFQVNNRTTNYQSLPCIAMNSSGYFVIAWQDTGGDGSLTGIIAKRYDNTGNPLSGEFQVNTYTPGYQHFTSMGMDSLGNFVVAWESDQQDGSVQGIHAQRFDSKGNRVDLEFQVNTYWQDEQSYPAAAMDSAGNFVIAWESRDQDGSGYGIYAQLYDSSVILRISDIEITGISDSKATITWNTNLLANSSVEYGFSEAYGYTFKNSSLSHTHIIELDGLQPGRLYHYRVVSYYNSTEVNISADFTFSTKYPIDLNYGWNLISLPLNQTKTDLGTALENISGDYDAVQFYDSSDLKDHWKHNSSKKISTGLNDLTDINRSMGIWIHITNPSGTILYVNGTAPDKGYVNQIPLNNGWNLVGYPSIIERLSNFDLPAEVDMVQYYNSSSGRWERNDLGPLPDLLNIMKPGQGYWIHYTGTGDTWFLEYVN